MKDPIYIGDVMIKDTNLIYIHVAKNGGTTMHSILDRIYHKEHTFDIIQDTDINTGQFINLSDNERKKIHLLKGHLYFGLHNHLFGKSDYITFLRKPEERIISYYYYILSLPNHSLYHKMTSEKITLAEFAQQMKHKDINNAQVRMISGVDDTGPVMLKKAIENIDAHFSFVGFQERFDESLVLLKNIYGWKTPYYKKKNVNLNRVSVRHVDAATLKLINHLNKEDNLLYAYCKHKFDLQMAQIPHLNLELKRLRLYSKIYSSTKLKILHQKLIKLGLK